jgi:hypothetical protein
MMRKFLPGSTRNGAPVVRVTGTFNWHVPQQEGFMMRAQRRKIGQAIKRRCHIGLKDMAFGLGPSAPKRFRVSAWASQQEKHSRQQKM